LSPLLLLLLLVVSLDCPLLNGLLLCCKEMLDIFLSDSQRKTFSAATVDQLQQAESSCHCHYCWACRRLPFAIVD
jgi:hypothetical protein